MKFRHCSYRILLLVCLNLFCVFLLVGCGASTATKTENINLKAGEYLSIPVILETEDLVEGTFTVQGPTNLDIKFAIQDSSGTTVYGPIQSRSQSFTYRAQAEGTHFLYLDNTYSFLNEKSVLLTYTYSER